MTAKALLQSEWYRYKQCLKWKNNYRSGTVNSKSFVGKDFLRNKWKYELTVHLKHEMIGKHFTETSNKVELWITRVQINRAKPVYDIAVGMNSEFIYLWRLVNGK